MTDIVAEVKDTVVVEKEVEKSKIEEIKSKEAEAVGNGDSNGDAKEEKAENGNKVEDKSVENGSVKENGVSESEEKTTDTKEPEVCGVKRKSEVGLESDEASVDSSEKKQKVEDSGEPEVAANGVC